VRGAFIEPQLPGILLSHMAGLRAVHPTSIATGGAAALVGLFAPWTSIEVKVSLGCLTYDALGLLEVCKFWKGVVLISGQRGGEGGFLQLRQ
jgi:hypothetical protein